MLAVGRWNEAKGQAPPLADVIATKPGAPAPPDPTAWSSREREGKAADQLHLTGGHRPVRLIALSASPPPSTSSTTALSTKLLERGGVADGACGAPANPFRSCLGGDKPTPPRTSTSNRRESRKERRYPPSYSRW